MQEVSFENRIVKERERTMHTQPDMLVLFLLEGQMTVNYHGDDILMKKDDILLINPGMSYETYNLQNAIYGVAVYPPELTSLVMEQKTIILYADSARDTSHSYSDLRTILYELTAQYSSNNRQTHAKDYSLLLQLLDTLIENYQVDQDLVITSETESEARMRQMMQYIMNHITEEISLSDLAESMFVSTSTLSRIFKKNTGVYFADYVMQLRVNTSLGLLRHSDQNLTHIAMNCGFSNSAAYNRAFKKVMGITPSEYREKHRVEAQEYQRQQELEKEALREELRLKGFADGKMQMCRDIRVRSSQAEREAYDQVWNKVINIGDMYTLSTANVQFQVEYLREHLHFTHFRMWNVFSVKMMISDGKTMGNYNFNMVHQILDFMLHHHIKPFLDLGRRPNTAVRSDGNTIYFEEEYIPFASKELWRDMVEAFFADLVTRYGEEEVSSWYFELTRDTFHNNMSLYEDPDYDFFDAWKSVYLIVKNYVPQASLGGFSVEPSGIDDDYRDLLRRCVVHDFKPDYLSFMMFPYANDEIIEGNIIKRELLTDSSREAYKLKLMKETMEECGLGDRPLYLVEFNNSISNRNHLNDSCFRSAYIVKSVADMWGSLDMLSMMAGSDWVSNYVDSTGLVNGGIGILTRDMIRKPAYFAIDFLNQMGSKFLAKGENYIATKSESGNIYILCFYFSWFRRNPMMEGENIDLDQCRQMIFEDEEPMKLRIDLEEMIPNANYVVKRRILNTKSGSIMDEWANFQYEPRLSRQDVKYLQAAATPKIEMTKLASDEKGRIHYEMDLDPLEVSLLHIYPRERVGRVFYT